MAAVAEVGRRRRAIVLGVCGVEIAIICCESQKPFDKYRADESAFSLLALAVA
jgi:hypothetical protein